jgi:hypothetical protein
MGAEDVKRILGKPNSITSIDGIQYWKYSALGYGNGAFKTTVFKAFVPIDENTSKLHVKYIKVSSIPSTVLLEVNGIPVGKTPYMVPVVSRFKELPTPGVEDSENETLIQPVRLKAIPIVNGGLVDNEYTYKFKREIVFYTHLVPYRRPNQIELNIRNVR